MVRFRSPSQAKEVGRILLSFPYDGRAGVSQNNRGAIIISNRREIVTVMTNGEVDREELV